jgi:hypothetical protein
MYVALVDVHVLEKNLAAHMAPHPLVNKNRSAAAGPLRQNRKNTAGFPFRGAVPRHGLHTNDVCDHFSSQPFLPPSQTTRRAVATLFAPANKTQQPQQPGTTRTDSAPHWPAVSSPFAFYVGGRSYEIVLSMASEEHPAAHRLLLQQHTTDLQEQVVMLPAEALPLLTRVLRRAETILLSSLEDNNSTASTCLELHHHLHLADRDEGPGEEADFEFALLQEGRGGGGGGGGATPVGLLLTISIIANKQGGQDDIR